jgi:hypothetical protein
MKKGLLCLHRIALISAVIFVAAVPAYAQGVGATTSLSGLVMDTSGGVIPGADVVVKNNATSAEYRASRIAVDGSPCRPLDPGTYTVTVALMGFKTFVAPDVQVIAATPANVRAVLEVGMLEEIVVVEGAAEIVQTQTASVATTISVQQIQALPLVTRTALDYVVALPGAITPGHRATRSTEISGASAPYHQHHSRRHQRPGQCQQGRRLLHDHPPHARLGGGNHRFDLHTGLGEPEARALRRSGWSPAPGRTGLPARSYNSWRNQAGTNDDDVMARNNRRGLLWRLNTPYWFNKRDLPKTAAGDWFIDDIRLQMPGFRVGGPIMKDKLFYFFNWEWFLWPTQANRTRYVLNPQAQPGCSATLRPTGAASRRSTCSIWPLPGATCPPRPGNREAAGGHPDRRRHGRERSTTTTRTRRSTRSVHAPRTTGIFPTTATRRERRGRTTGSLFHGAVQPVRWKARPAEQRRASVSRIPELGRAVRGPVPVAGHVALHHRVEHGQRSPHWVDGQLWQGYSLVPRSQ